MEVYLQQQKSVHFVFSVSLTFLFLHVGACVCFNYYIIIMSHLFFCYIGQSWVNDAASEKLRQQIFLSDNDNGMVGCKTKYGG